MIFFVIAEIKASTLAATVATVLAMEHGTVSHMRPEL